MRLLDAWQKDPGSYGRIAKHTLGLPGIVAVRVSVLLVQAGYITSYFIFVPAYVFSNFYSNFWLIVGKN